MASRMRPSNDEHPAPQSIRTIWVRTLVLLVGAMLGLAAVALGVNRYERNVLDETASQFEAEVSSVVAVSQALRVADVPMGKIFYELAEPEELEVHVRAFADVDRRVVAALDAAQGVVPDGDSTDDLEMARVAWEQVAQAVSKAQDLWGTGEVGQQLASGVDPFAEQWAELRAVQESLVESIDSSTGRLRARVLWASRVEQELAAVLLGAVMVALLLSGWSARRLSRQVVTPLVAVQRAAVRMGEGDLMARVKLENAVRELDDLATSVNDMGASLLRDIDERRRVENEVRMLNAELEQRVAERTAELTAANGAKSEFLSRMSHELRTPLNAILGFGQLLEMEDQDPQRIRNVRHILQAGHHLLDLIDEVLDIAQIETGKMALSLEPVRVREVIEEATDLMRPLAVQRGVSLEVAASHDPYLYVHADRQRLKQVLLNLLSNAVKYTHSGGHVTVANRRVRKDRLSIDVHDDGAGISSEHHDRLFTPFDRLGADQSDVEGTGLGLAVSKKLTEAMKGNIDVTSEVGRGSTFSVELLLAAAPDIHDKDRTVGVPPPVQDHAESRTLLYIEDNPANVQLIEGVLAHRPHCRLLSAMQGGLGVELARQHRPDAVLLDLALPDMSGHHVLAMLQKDPMTAGIPIIVITADASPGVAERLFAAGAREFITKPIDVSRLLHLIDATAGVGSDADPSGDAAM